MTRERRQVLREMAEALSPGAAVSVPAAWLLELLHASALEAEPAVYSVGDLARRYRRGASSIRVLCEAGSFRGAFKLNGKAWRIPAAAVEAWERTQGAEQLEHTVPRPPRKRGRDLGAWRRADLHPGAKPERAG